MLLLYELGLGWLLQIGVCIGWFWVVVDCGLFCLCRLCFGLMDLLLMWIDFDSCWIDSHWLLGLGLGFLWLGVLLI